MLKLYHNRQYAVVFILVLLISSQDISANLEPQLIFSHALGLKVLNLTSLRTQELYTNGFNIFDLDFLWHESEPLLFWSDMEKGIFSGSLKDGELKNVKSIFSHGISSVEGIAVDWIAQNLYWVDNRYGWIEVASLGHNWRSVIITNIDAPRALALDSRDGLLFWTDRSDSRPKIERSTMSGEMRREIVDVYSLSGGGYPNGLTIDYVNRRVFWIDAKSDSVHSTNYDGNELQEHLYQYSNAIQSPFGLSFYNNELYWADEYFHTINKINIVSGNASEVIHKTYHSLYGVLAVHENHHPPTNDNENPCLHLDCSHLCLLDGPDTAVCRCPQLMTLSSDDKHCREVEDMILVSEFHKEGNDGFYVILGLSDSSSVKPLTYPIVPPLHTDIVGLELDDISGYIYWADASTNTMWKASIYDQDIKKELYLGNGKLTGFGANWRTDTIYYSSSGRERGIFSCSLRRNICASIVKSLYEPQLLTLHPALQKLFWVEKTPERLQVVSSNLDGTNYTIIYNTKDDPQLNLFKSFTFDPTGTDLYWIDSSRSEILRYDMNNLKSISKFNSSFEIDSLFIDKERILVSDNIGQVHALNKSNGQYLSVIYNSTGAIKKLRPVKTLRTSSHKFDPCYTNNGGCDGQCFSDSEGRVSCRPWSTIIPPTANLSFDITTASSTDCLLKCKNGGRCEQLVPEKYSCKCRSGYFGSLCQHSVCHNYCFNGQCYLNENDEPLCVCLANYYGPRCEKSVCDKICQQGYCQLVEGLEQCVCNPGWSGSICDVSLNEAFRNISISCEEFCQNIDQTSELEQNTTCRCQPQLSEENCKCSVKDRVVWLLIILESLALFAALLCLFWIKFSFCLRGRLLRRNKPGFKSQHCLLVDYNSNGPSEIDVVYDYSPAPTHLNLFHHKRTEADDLQQLTENEEVNLSRNCLAAIADK